MLNLDPKTEKKMDTIKKLLEDGFINKEEAVIMSGINKTDFEEVVQDIKKEENISSDFSFVEKTEDLSPKKSLVTGGAGFIGSNLVDELIKEGHEVVVIDNLSSGKKEYINEKAKFYEVDIVDKEDLDKIFDQEKPDYVFHLAAQINTRKSVTDPDFDNKVNILGGLNVLESCKNHNVEKIIFASSGGAIHGETINGPASEQDEPMPLNPYGINKLAFEKYLNYYYKTFGQKYISIRPSNAYGPRQFKGGEAGVTAVFIDNAVNNKKTIINGDGLQTRDFVYVGDIVNAFLLAVKSDQVGGFNIGSGEETNMLDLIRIIEQKLGRKIEREFGPEKVGDIKRSALDPTKAKNVLGWRPQTTLEEGIEKTLNWSKGGTKEKFLITGGAGFIGSHVARELIKRGDEVVIIDNFNDYYDPQLKEDRIRHILGDYNFKLYRGDIRDQELLKEIFEKENITKVMHFAAMAGVRYSLEKPFLYEEVNVRGTLNLLDLAAKHKVKNFVFASSSSLYGERKTTPFSEEDRVDHPISPYAATKRAKELMSHVYSHLYGLNVTGLRYFTVYGPWGRPDMSYFIFADKMRQGKPIDVYNKGQMSRNFTYIDDIVTGTIKALDNPVRYSIMNIGGDKEDTLMRFIEVLEDSLGAKAEKNMLPMQPGDVKQTVADISKLRKLGWAPTTKIEEGLKRFADWYKEYYK
jgi:UDP-glucuronate 4-epimerase